VISVGKKTKNVNTNYIKKIHYNNGEFFHLYLFRFKKAYRPDEKLHKYGNKYTSKLWKTKSQVDNICIIIQKKLPR